LNFTVKELQVEVGMKTVEKLTIENMDIVFGFVDYP